jgi:hypothetical protein
MTEGTAAATRRVWRLDIRSLRKHSLLGRASKLTLPMVLALFASTAVRAGTEPTPRLRVESNSTGEIALEAHGVTIDEALDAIAAEAGFEVVIEHGITRPPVDISLSMAPVENVLRQVLRGRNYALVYDGEDEFPTEVIVLPPSAPRRPGVYRPGIRRGSRTARRR